MTEAWKQWEGQAVSGGFHLRQYLGGSESSAVFLTEYGEREPQKAAIKLIAPPPEQVELQLSEWALAAKLSHPCLIRIFQMGRCRLDDMQLLYIVTEYAEENLCQILPYRPLTPAEARDMLDPILNALAYVHGQGLVHGRIKPANIMAVEDHLKISSDALRRIDRPGTGLAKPGAYDAPEVARGEISPAADVWSLGITLVEALTQHLPVREGSEQGGPALPEILPAPFDVIARNSLRLDVQRRWTIPDIVARLQPAPQGRTDASPPAASAKWRYVVPAVAFGLLLAALLGSRLLKRPPNAQPIPSAVVEQPGVQPEPARKPPVPEAPQPAQTAVDNKQGAAAPQPEAEPSTPAVGRVPGQVIHQVLPEVPRQARDTITGKVRVGVRVRVDPSGRVVGAKLAPPGPSRYFDQLALKAARRWKFSPAKVDAASVPSEWILRFEFGRTATKVVPARAAP